MFLKTLIMPGQVFRDIAKGNELVIHAVHRQTFLLVILPPIFAWVGSSTFGWRLGAEDPLYFVNTASVIISFFYAMALGFGYITTVLLASWMAKTYGANADIEEVGALITVVVAPLSIASIAHLYPQVFINVIILIPAVIWSMNLLYRGLPVVMKITPERGMLMSSSLVGWLLVAFVSLLGISAGLWTYGLGPSIGV
jgi:hypothetical protein